MRNKDYYDKLIKSLLIISARGKKKQLKNLIPLLIAAKVKLGLLATLAYFAIGIIAKKAIFASLISLAISAFIGLKALWSNKGANVYHHDLTAYNSGWNAPAAASGWSGPVVNTAWSSPVSSGWDEHASYAHNQAYSGYHH